MNIDRDSFIEGVVTVAQSVYSFHERFDIPSVEISDPDGTFEALRERLLLLAEETGENASALNRGDVAGAVEEAVDIAYIAVGTVLRLGFTGRRLSRRRREERCQDAGHVRQARGHGQGRPQIGLAPSCRGGRRYRRQSGSGCASM